MTSPFETEAFRKLKEAWYAKLADSGFEDLEKPDGSLADDGRLAYLRRHIDPAQMAAAISYYDQASAYLHHGHFGPGEALVWRLHAEGRSKRQIAVETGLSPSGVWRRICRHRKAAGLTPGPDHA